jgi:sec-independent protein translocase protein TatA
VHFGTGELIVLAVTLLIVFSASRMGALGNAMGKFVHSFRKASKGEGFVDGKATRSLDRSGAPIEDAQIVEPPRDP